MMVATLGVMVALLAGCSSKPAPSPATPTPPAAPVVVPGPTAKAPPPSVARTPKEYRQDAARHLDVRRDDVAQYAKGQANDDGGPAEA